MDVMQVACCLLVGYACGNLLTADLVCRAKVGRSAFQTGDGNPGMANVGHTLGVGAAVAVLAGDIGKTLLAWCLGNAMAPVEGSLAGLIAGVGVTLGHNYPVWHGFRGGKGVTTTCSAIILANPVTGLASCLVGLATVLLEGHLCVGAVAITTAWLVLSAAFGTPAQTIAAVMLEVLMVMAHGSAIRGIATGKTGRATLSAKFWVMLGHPRKS